MAERRLSAGAPLGGPVTQPNAGASAQCSWSAANSDSGSPYNARAPAHSLIPIRIACWRRTRSYCLLICNPWRAPAGTWTLRPFAAVVAVVPPLVDVRSWQRAKRRRLIRNASLGHSVPDLTRPELSRSALGSGLKTHGPLKARSECKSPPASLPTGLMRNDHTALALGVTATVVLVERLDRERLGRNGGANHASDERERDKCGYDVFMSLSRVLASRSARLPSVFAPGDMTVTGSPRSAAGHKVIKNPRPVALDCFGHFLPRCWFLDHGHIAATLRAERCIRCGRETVSDAPEGIGR